MNGYSKELEDKYLKMLNEMYEEWKDDRETLHIEYDDVLGAILVELGYEKLVEKYNSTYKWYA